jgi:pyrroloquinoline quinone (PQQ) biosynthesis protein C
MRLLVQEPYPSTQAYIDLHEEVISSGYPYAQVAIELEIEGLAVVWAPKFINNVKAVLGEDTCAELSFWHEHIALDVGHTAFNRRLMNLLLAERGVDVEMIATVGRRALNTYIDFLGQLWSGVQGSLGESGRHLQHVSPAAAAQRLGRHSESR